jgi:preprotein translocase subunit YajC
MGVTIALAAVPAVCAAVATIAVAWLQVRGRRQQARDRARQDHVCSLPPGSRVVDLGRHGLVIEIGPRPGGEGNHHRAAR